MEPTANSQPPTALLPLDQPRVISFAHRGRVYTYHLRRILADDWDNYFGAMSIQSRREGAAQVSFADVATAGQLLVENCVEKVEGYAEGFGEEEGWKKQLPAGHTGKVADLLCDVRLSAELDEAPLDPRHFEVKLDAAWSSGALAGGSSAAPSVGWMVEYRGLAHRFAPPTADHRRRYNRAATETRVLGGPRGTTIYGAHQRLLIGFYDELIQSVEGYGVAGVALTTDRDQIKREMDCYHKVGAAAQLFADPDSVAPKEEKKEAA